MDRAEFDKFADEYRALHTASIRLSGESPDYFAEYKVIDAARLASQHKLPPVPEILDFGAGVGNSIPYFTRHMPGCRLTCLDVSERSLAVALARFPGLADLVAFDGERFPFLESRFDLVFAACVFHHIPPERHTALLTEFRRTLKPGGLALIFEHNPQNPLTVRAVRDCPFDENAILIPPVSLLQSMRLAGFSRPQRSYRVFFPHALRALRRLDGCLNWLPLGAQYYVCATK